MSILICVICTVQHCNQLNKPIRIVAKSKIKSMLFIAVRYGMKQKESRAEHVSRLYDVVSGRKPVVGFA
jgi:hypothetical protein